MDSKDSNKKSKECRYSSKDLIIVIILSLSIALCILGYHESTMENVLSKHTKSIEMAKISSLNDYLEARKIEEKDNLKKCLFETVKKLQPKIDSQIANHIVDSIIEECKEKNIDPILITALIYVESKFDPMAISKKGAIGLMQVRYEIWKETPELKNNGIDTKDKLFWVDLNISCGTSIFKKYYEEADKDIVKTLWRYNSGQKKLPCQFYNVDYANKILIKSYEIKSEIYSLNGKIKTEEV